jgi:nicotinic acid mononucleotide adenylyltransferase
LENSDAYVRNKLGRDWILAKDRCDLCKQVIKEETENQEKAIQEGKVIQEETTQEGKVIQEETIQEGKVIKEETVQGEKVEDWIAVSAGECNWTGFADFDEVTMSLAKFLNEECRFIDHPLTVVYVCGLDHFNKCPYVARLAKCKNIACAVIYRPGAFDDGIKDFKEESSNIYYITLDDERETLIDISSTAIRNRYRNGNNTDTFDGTYSCVRSFLQKHYSKK